MFGHGFYFEVHLPKLCMVTSTASHMLHTNLTTASSRNTMHSLLVIPTWLLKLAGPWPQH